MRKCNERVFFLLLFLATTNSSCVFDRDDHKLKLYNNTGKDFFYILKGDSVIYLKDVDYINYESRFHISKSGDTSLPLFARINEGGYEQKINNDCLDSTLFLYLFQADSVKKYNWASIIENKSVFIRRGFKVRDLNRLNWLIKIEELLPN